MAYERKRVDEPVPALGDRTPREAWADPDTRAQVEALLHGPGPMDADRIRGLLDG